MTLGSVKLFRKKKTITYMEPKKAKFVKTE